MFFLILLVLILVCASLAFSAHQKLSRLQRESQDVFFQLALLLVRRYEQIPHLIDALRADLIEEQAAVDVLLKAKTTAAAFAGAMRQQVGGIDTVSELAIAEQKVVEALKQLTSLLGNRLAHNAPAAKIAEEITVVEGKVVSTREAYNNLVREYNLLRETFWGRLVTSRDSFKRAQFFIHID